MAYKFSPSSLSLLKECARCFWLHFNLNIRRPEGIFPSLPGGMDRILKEHFDSFINKGKLPPEISNLEGYSLFGNIELLTTWRNNFKGIQWKDETGNLIAGAVDNILLKENKLVVLDYKTRGHPLKEETSRYYHDQLDIYNFLLRKNGFETQDYSYLLFYHPNKVIETGTVLFHTNLVKVPVSMHNAEQIISKAVSTLQGELPKLNPDCSFCKWQNDKIITQEKLVAV